MLGHWRSLRTGNQSKLIHFIHKAVNSAITDRKVAINALHSEKRRIIPPFVTMEVESIDDTDAQIAYQSLSVFMRPLVAPRSSPGM